MELIVHVADLGVPTLTRPRGREAYRNLRERWREGSVALVLDGVPMLSLSFLDGIVLELLARGETDRVTFVTTNPRTREKLARVAGLHPEAALYTAETAHGAHQRITPASVTMEDAAFEPTKSTAADPPEANPWSARAR